MSDCVTNDVDVKAANYIRDKENSNDGIVEKDLVEMIEMLERAIGNIEEQMKAGGASMITINVTS